MKTKEEIEQLAESQYGTEIDSIRGSNPYDLEADRKNGYIKGYTQCQEDIGDKKYTEEDLMSAFNAGINNDYGNGLSFDQWLNSLNKQD